MFLIFTSTGVNASQELRGLSANNEESGNQIAVTRGANKKFQWAYIAKAWCTATK